MCSRKAFSSRELFAKTGMNSSELACNTARKSQAPRSVSARPVLLPCHTERSFPEPATRQIQHGTGCQLRQELVPSNSFKWSLVSGTTGTPGRGFSLYLKHQACTTRRGGALTCCKVTTESNNSQSTQAIPFFLPASQGLHCLPMAGNRCKGSSATLWSR